MTRSLGERRRRLVALAVVLLLAVVFAHLSGQRWIKRLESDLTRETITADSRTRNRFRTALRRSGALNVQPPSRMTVEDPTGADGRCPDPVFGPRQPTAGEMPSSWMAPPELLRSDRAGVSLALEPCRLRRLDTHRQAYGRDWEEVGWVSFFDDGKLRFATAVGVRIHGRYRRRFPTPSFRFYFRGGLGATAIPRELVHPDLTYAPRRLVVKWDPRERQGRAWPFAEPVALDIARRLGAHAPFARPVALSLNGGDPQVYHLVERIDDEFLAARFGHTDFDLLRSKDHGSPGNRELERQIRWLRSQPKPLALQAVEARFDTDQLVASLLTAAYCAVGDTFQEAMVRDRRGGLAGGRWTWVQWDLDGAFRTLSRARRFRGHDELLSNVFEENFRGRFLPDILLRRLLRESPAFRAVVGRRFVEALNHDLTPEFVAGLAARYGRLAEEMAAADDPFVRGLPGLLERRHAAMRELLERYFDVGPFVPVDVRGAALVVDGREVRAPRRLYYPAGTTVRIAIPEPLRARFVGWRGEGLPEATATPELAFEVLAATTIEARFRD